MLGKYSYRRDQWPFMVLDELLNQLQQLERQRMTALAAAAFFPTAAQRLAELNDAERELRHYIAHATPGIRC